MKTAVAAALATLVAATSLAPSSAEARDRRYNPGAVAAAGIIGLAAGAIIAGSARPSYGYGYGGGYYAPPRPVYVPPPAYDPGYGYDDDGAEEPYVVPAPPPVVYAPRPAYQAPPRPAYPPAYGDGYGYGHGYDGPRQRTCVVRYVENPVSNIVSRQRHCW